MRENNKPSKKIFEKVAVMAAVFGSPARLRILNLIAQAPRSVDEISQVTGESVANTSQHLQKMLAARLVCVKKNKLQRIYSLSESEIAQILEHFMNLAEKVSPELIHLEEQMSSAALSLEQKNNQDLVEWGSIIADLQSKKAVLIDVRDECETQYTPIQGALNIPKAELKAQLSDMKKNKSYYVVCRGRACDNAVESVQLMKAFGFDAYRLKESAALLSAKQKTQKKEK